jgi:hypothetical protein
VFSKAYTPSAAPASLLKLILTLGLSRESGAILTKDGKDNLDILAACTGQFSFSVVSIPSSDPTQYK